MIDIKDVPITALKGVSDARQKLFASVGVFSVEDLLHYYPRAYQDRGNLKTVEQAEDGEQVALELKVLSPVNSARIRASRAHSVQNVVASDDTGTVKLTFFNRPYLKDTLKVGRTFRFFGVLIRNRYGTSMASPIFEPTDTGVPLLSLVPVYPLTAGLTDKLISTCMKQIFEQYKTGIPETLSEDLRKRHGFPGRYEALCEVHFPTDKQNLETARRRLAFEELYRFYVRTAALGKRVRRGNAYRIRYPDMRAFTSALPFELTLAQKHAIQDILRDMTAVSSPDDEQKCGLPSYVPPARRLVQGDVGCGKTMVAAAAVYAVCRSGLQAALMVPSSILARQHYEELSGLLEQFGIRTALLVGGMKASEKKSTLEQIANGEIGLVVGTHALIEDNVAFQSLALAITDEQHRFGVLQRKALEKKGREGILPHTVVMSATPIPRTLAMILYCDLDISIIDQMPKGRIPVETFSVGEDKRNRVYHFIAGHVKDGKQAYILCPLAEENTDGEAPKPAIELSAAKEYQASLQKTVLADIPTAYIHGKMKPSEKEDIMARFVAGEIKVLVSTTVIEVGVNVPNAVVMFIENAERYGLSQLHQLRGRVGRGKDKSYCILMSPLLGKRSADSPFAKRMEILCKSTNGFEIAEKDLELRGPGEFFGLRQSGELAFRLANPVTDADLFVLAKSEAEKSINSV